jgi:hypothetical protein
VVLLLICLSNAKSCSTTDEKKLNVEAFEQFGTYGEIFNFKLCFDNNEKYLQKEKMMKNL